VEEIAAALARNAESPEDYVIRQMRSHDVVFLGEAHKIKHDPLFVAGLIPRLHSAGVYALGFEFATRRSQPLVDRLVNAVSFDTALANEVLLRSFAYWGYQEYRDVLEAAWRVNRHRPEGTPAFRVIALNDSPDWSYGAEPGAPDADLRQSLVWGGQDERLWAMLLLDSLVYRSKKVLVYTGIHHAFTRYRQPVVVAGSFRGFSGQRMGNLVYSRIGERAMTIFLSAPLQGRQGYESPHAAFADGVFDVAMESSPGVPRRFGVDLKGTLYGQLPWQNSVYSHGYPQFSLADFADGLVVQGPLESFEPVSAKADYFQGWRLAFAQAQAVNPRLRGVSRQEAQQVLADAPRETVCRFVSGAARDAALRPPKACGPK
jgi:hypothetical protein